MLFMSAEEIPFLLANKFISLLLNNSPFRYTRVLALMIRLSKLSRPTTINPVYRVPLGIISRCRSRSIWIVSGTDIAGRRQESNSRREGRRRQRRYTVYGRCLDWIKGALHRSKGPLIRSGKKQRVLRVA